jgi:hypothetical protein
MKKNYLALLITFIVLTSIIALSAHALILHYFNPPVINIDPELNQVIGFIIRFAMVIGAILIYLLSKETWKNIKPFYSVILFAVLIMALTEQLFRSPMMEIVAGVPWAYQALSTIPSYISFLTLSLLIFLFLPVIARKNKFNLLKYIFFAALTTAILFFIRKLANDFLSPLLALVPQIDMTKLIHPPYGMDVMIPAYITFLEPTIACFVLFYLIKNNVGNFNTLSKGLIIGGLLILIHGGIYSLVQIAYSEGNILYRVFYYGQFLWEYLALGILTAYSFVLLGSSRHPQ